MLSLPADILILIFETLSVADLTSLSLTCHDLNTIVNSYGWSAYLRVNPRPSYTLSKARASWKLQKQAHYDSLTDSAWSKPKFTARTLSRPWAGKLQPVLAISPSRLVIGAGSNVYSYAFGVPNHRGASPPVRSEGFVSLLYTRSEHPHLEDRPRSITSITFIPDGGRDCVLDVAFLDGGLERVILQPPPAAALFESDTPAPALRMTRTNLTPMPWGDFIESLSVDSTRSIVLALASNGGARLSRIPNIGGINPNDPLSLQSLSLTDTPASHLSLSSRSWKSLLSLSSPYPYAAFGTSGNTPLVIHSVADGGILEPIPSAVLHTRGVVGKVETKRAIISANGYLGAPINPITGTNVGPNASANGSSTPDNLPSSAVYGLTHAPHCAPWGASSQVLVSGWFDGEVRIYDLRSSDRFGWEERTLSSSQTTTSVSSAATSTPTSSNSTATSSSSNTPLRSSTPSNTQTYQVPLLKPAMTLSDKWSDEPIYAVSAGGGNGACVAAGTGRHSVVAMFDVRVGGTSGTLNTNAGGERVRGMSGRWRQEPGREGTSAATNNNDSNVDEGEGDADETANGGLMKGWSVHAPGNDQSPVYDVIMESDRVWGVTQARGFVFDFSPNVSPTTYPSIPLDPGLKMRGRKGVGMHVVKYLHREGRWVD